MMRQAVFVIDNEQGKFVGFLRAHNRTEALTYIKEHLPKHKIYGEFNPNKSMHKQTGRHFIGRNSWMKQ